ncbi:unannotated protein [freshwater metagenome]|uniref:Unannotated protein n=1 Tax=freshwater metagenome TaxID=449393 RepID=A0A6J7VZD3_9ZZZZ
MLTDKTSLMPSRWPWSYSFFSSPVQRAPLPAMLTPTSNKCVRSCQPSNFGPAITTCGRSITASNNFSRVVGVGAQSSCNIHNHSCAPETLAGSFSTACCIALPKPKSRGAESVGIFAPLRSFGDASIEPVSIAMI